jgi:hypothetical protein
LIVKTSPKLVRKFILTEVCGKWVFVLTQDGFAYILERGALITAMLCNSSSFLWSTQYQLNELFQGRGNHSVFTA